MNELRLFRNVFLLDGVLDDDPTIEEDEAAPHAIAITRANSVIDGSRQDGWACTFSYLRLKGNRLRDDDPDEYVHSLRCMRQYEKTVLSAYLCVMASEEDRDDGYPDSYKISHCMQIGEASPGMYRERLTSVTVPAVFRRDSVEIRVREILWLSGNRLDHCMDEAICEALSHLGFYTEEEAS